MGGVETDERSNEDTDVAGEFVEDKVAIGGALGDEGRLSK